MFDQLGCLGIRRVGHDGVSVKTLNGQEVLHIGDVGGDDSASDRDILPEPAAGSQTIWHDAGR